MIYCSGTMLSERIADTGPQWRGPQWTRRYWLRLRTCTGSYTLLDCSLWWCQRPLQDVNDLCNELLRYGQAKLAQCIAATQQINNSREW